MEGETQRGGGGPVGGDRALIVSPFDKIGAAKNTKGAVKISRRRGCGNVITATDVSTSQRGSRQNAGEAQKNNQSLTNVIRHLVGRGQSTMSL